ncbi:helix-turn-helix transcriptional regulator [Sedimenticola hydrogenitrophicus]|uniref:helix-turn-helix transcriptional regulator n=1 Tax=Sedimenticola hydrogenitrophicus TaxID=2967975 RepID=UPI0021A792B4|nr:helix-turn-helix domain-containing protein [Sedimenticola hydrogenitrophicus]
MARPQGIKLIQNKLKELRNSKSLSQEELADEVGVTRTCYIDWEVGRSGPSTKNFEKLVTCLAVRPEDLKIKDEDHNQASLPGPVTGSSHKNVNLKSTNSAVELRKLILGTNPEFRYDFDPEQEVAERAADCIQLIELLANEFSSASEEIRVVGRLNTLLKELSGEKSGITLYVGTFESIDGIRIDHQNIPDNCYGSDFWARRNTTKKSLIEFSSLSSKEKICRVNTGYSAKSIDESVKFYNELINGYYFSSPYGNDALFHSDSPEEFFRACMTYFDESSWGGLESLVSEITSKKYRKHFRKIIKQMKSKESERRNQKPGTV